ncbi:hypothetical protein OROMI_015745 [Orobanche minor]
MAKKQQRKEKNSKGPFKKMYDATIGRICHRHRRSHAPAGTARTPPSEPSRAPNSHYSHDPSQEVASTSRVGKSEGKKFEHTKSTNQRFNEIKDKMRATSNVGADEAEKKKSMQRRDSLNDKVTNYLNKMRMKLARTITTTVGDDNKGV